MAKPHAAFAYPYPRPAATADMVVWRIARRRLEVLLIERRGEPFAGRWAIPGGFINENEAPVDAARRELREEAGLDLPLCWPAGVYGNPGRDPRGWTISAAFYATTRNAAPVAGDDAAAFGWHSARRLPPLAFDHADILADAALRLRRDARILPVAAGFLEPKFTAEQLHAAYRAFDPATPEDSAAFAGLAAAWPFLKSTDRFGQRSFRAPRAATATGRRT